MWLGTQVRFCYKAARMINNDPGQVRPDNSRKKKEKQKKKPFTTRVLSQIKYQDADIDFQLPEELSGNLRNINSIGSILHDRFKSLQKRNILAPTIKRHYKKAKVKKYERNHTKMDWEKNDSMSSFKKLLKKSLCKFKERSRVIRLSLIFL
mgnify:CR=1 FL=1